MIKVVNILSEIREDMEKKAHKKYGNSYSKDLEGFCDTAAIKVFEAIKDIVPTVIAGNDMHWFNIIKHEGEELILDITATQFGRDFQPIEIREFPFEDDGYWEVKYVIPDVSSLKVFQEEIGWESVEL